MTDFLSVYGTTPLVLVDFPFGYRHKTLRPYIDKVIYLQIPLDIAFARQIIRDDTHKSTAEIISWAQQYLNSARPYFVENQRYVSENADLILDGTLPLKDKVAKLIKLIQSLQKKRWGITVSEIEHSLLNYVAN